MAEKDVSAIGSAAGMMSAVWMALDKAVHERGGSYNDIHRLATPEGEKLIAGMADLIVAAGKKDVEVVDHLIDLAAKPFVPERLMVAEHTGKGTWKFNMEEIDLFLADGQKDEKHMIGNELHKELKDKPTWNANVLDYLYTHQELIPESWKGKVVYFWGTIYRHADSRLCVRCLHWQGDRWCQGYYWLGSRWSSKFPAAVRKPRQ